MIDFKKDFENLKENAVVLIVSTAEDLLKTNTKILKILTKDKAGLYITINQPYETLQRTLQENKIDTNKIFFIDCITETASGKGERSKNCLYVASPASLTELGIAITHALQAMPTTKKFLFMDSLSTLVIYNSAGTIARFSHFLMSKMKLLGVTGVFMSVERELDEKLMVEIEQFCDKVIKVKGENINR